MFYKPTGKIPDTRHSLYPDWAFWVSLQQRSGHVFSLSFILPPEYFLFNFPAGKLLVFKKLRRPNPDLKIKHQVAAEEKLPVPVELLAQAEAIIQQKGAEQPLCLF